MALSSREAELCVAGYEVMEARARPSFLLGAKLPPKVSTSVAHDPAAWKPTVAGYGTSRGTRSIELRLVYMVVT